jgi:hypothetical protein
MQLKPKSPQLFPSNPSTIADFFVPSIDVVDAVLRWLNEIGPRSTKRVSFKVPGASVSETARLGALGALVSRMPGMSVRSDFPAAVRSWLDSRVVPPSSLVEQVAEAIWTDGPEFLANLYEAIVAAPNRRRLGTFFTPSSTVEWMLRAWEELEGAPQLVIDVGAGVGAFSLRAHARWPKSRIAAIDVNPVTLGLLAVLARSRGADDRITYELDDFVTWGKDRHADPPTLVLGNPPYTRLELLPARERRCLMRTVSDCGWRAGLSTWMLAAALQRLRPQDGLLFLLPTNWLDAQYAQALRAKLWIDRSRRIELTHMDKRLFGTVMVETVTLLVGPQKETTGQPFVARNHLKRCGRTLMQRRGQNPPDLKGLLKLHTHKKTPVAAYVQLEQLGVVRRGLATGANNFFTLSSDEVEFWGLPTSVLKRVVRRSRDFPKDHVLAAHFEKLPSTIASWLLCIEPGRRISPKLATYLEYGEQQGYSQRHICRQRQVWYMLGSEICIPDVIVGSMTKGQFRCIENRARAAITNNNYGLTWHPETKPPVRKAALAWLRSEDGQSALRKEARSHAVGLYKLEPRAVARLKVPVLELK